MKLIVGIDIGTQGPKVVVAWERLEALGADGVTFIPALCGKMAPEWNAGARGCFYGLTPAHGAGHRILRRSRRKR